MNPPSSSRLRDKVNALLWIPDGEIDDTRFEKLHDELERMTKTSADLLALLNHDLVPTLESSLYHVDERIRSISSRLLGALVRLFSFPSDHITIIEEAKVTSRRLAARFLQKMCTEATLTAADPLEIESLCFCASRWISLLCQTLPPQVWLSLLQHGLSINYHFIRLSATQLFEEACKLELESVVLPTLDFATSSPSEAQTSLNLISIVSISPLAEKLRKHIRVNTVYDHLESMELVVAEAARCCLRTFINHAPHLLCDDGLCSTFLNRLESVVERLIKRNDSWSLKSALALLSFQPSSPLTQFSIEFEAWCKKSLQSVLSFGSIEASGTGFCLADFGQIYIHHQELVVDQVVGLFLKSSHNQSQNFSWDQILKIIQIVDIFLSKSRPSPTTTQAASKLLQLLKRLWTTITPQDDAFHPLFKRIMLSANVSTQTKVFALQVAHVVCLHHLTTETPNWTVFDQIYGPVLGMARFSPAWEVRDSVQQTTHAILGQCKDLVGCMSRKMMETVLSGLGDSSEYVRATAWATIGQSISEELFFRTAQCQAIGQLLSIVHLRSSLQLEGQAFLDHLRRFLHTMLDDDDWEVRQGVVSILVVLAEVTEDQIFWIGVGGTDLLQTASEDESRIVRQQTWRLVFHLLKNGSSSIEKGWWASMAPQDVQDRIEAQDVEETYDPDDEVYPLAPGAASNDLDCPF